MHIKPLDKVACILSHVVQVLTKAAILRRWYVADQIEDVFRHICPKMLKHDIRNGGIKGGIQAKGELSGYRGQNARAKGVQKIMINPCEFVFLAVQGSKLDIEAR